MTVIAAFATDDHVVMGCDTRYDYSGTGLYAQHGKIGTLTASDGGEVLIAASGNGSLLSVVLRDLKIDGIPNPSDPADADRWADAIAVAITDLIADAKPSVLSTNEGVGHIDGTFVVAWRQYIWWIYTHTAVRVQGPVLAIGSGAEVALGSLNTSIALGAKPEDAVDMAVRLACQYASGCGMDERGPLMHTTATD